MPFLFLLFIIVPIIEITILINVGEAIGAWYTVALVLLSAFIGVNMLRYQGISTLARAQQRMQSGEMPGQEMIEGLVLAVGGALLVTPGFVTDAIGFCCLIPFTRQAFVRGVMSRAKVVTMNQTGFSQHSGSGPFGAQPQSHDSNFEHQTRSDRSPFHNDQDSPRAGDVFEGDFTRDDEKK